MAANLSFSYSKLGLYKECPQKYKFRYILKIPEKPRHYFAFGSALHKVMEFLYSSGKPPFPSLETTLKFFKTDWDATSYDQKGYADAAKEKEGFAEGVRIIKAYYEKHQKDDFAPLATEFKSTVNVDGLSVISIVDRIDYLGNGKVSILDYKTGKSSPHSPDQLMMYQKLMDGNPQLLEMVKRRDATAKEVKVANMLFYFLPELKEDIVPPAGKGEIDNFWAGVLKVAADIIANKFEPDPGETKCRFCDYRAMCPVWGLTPADEAFADAAAGAEINPQAALSAKIDACGAAMAQAEKLKKEITQIMAENNFAKHFGKKYAAEFETIKTLDFKDRDKTMEVLKQFNLLPKVCVPTLASIQKLLQSGALAQPQQKILQDLSITKEIQKLNITPTEE